MNGRHRKHLVGLLTALAAVGFLVWGVVPKLWGPPSVTVQIPDSWPAAGPGEITVRVSAAHPNWVVSQVYVLFERPTAAPSGGNNLEVVMVHENAERPVWTRTTLRRMRGARLREMTLAVPLDALDRRGWLGHGALSGRVAVDAIYPQTRSRHSVWNGVYRNEPLTFRQPFTVTLEAGP